MKKWMRGAAAALSLSAALAYAQPTQAQTPPKPVQAKKVSKLDKMAQDLNLTAAQKAQIKPILDAAAAQNKIIRNQTNAKIEPILNAAQKAKFEASLHHHKKKA